MESKFAHVLLESCLKMMSLTEANIFILIEAEDNRRYYGGKKHLCEAFGRGALQPTSMDVEMEANVHTTCLSPKPSSLPDGTSWSSIGTVTNLPHHNLDDGRLVSFGGSGSPSTTATAKLAGQKRSLSASNQPHVKHLKIEAADEDQTSTYDIKDEPLAGDTESSVLSVNGYIEGRNDSETVIDDEDDDIVVLNEDNPISATMTMTASDIAPIGAAQWIMEQLQTDQTTLRKLQAVQALQNLDVLQEKDSVERKIVLSLFYSLGSHFASSFMQGGDNDKDSRENIFQNVWTLMSNLQNFANLKVPRKDGMLGTLISRCKDSFFAPYRLKKFKTNKKEKS